MPGKLWAAGHQVGLSCLSRPEKNAQSFITNPFTDEEGGEKYLAAYVVSDEKIHDSGSNNADRQDTVTEDLLMQRKCPGILTAKSYAKTFHTQGIINHGQAEDICTAKRSGVLWRVS